MRDTPSGDRTSSPTDVPGTMLNVAMLNLSASDEDLRVAAYRLVNELSYFYKLEGIAKVPDVTGE